MDEGIYNFKKPFYKKSSRTFLFKPVARYDKFNTLIKIRIYNALASLVKSFNRVKICNIFVLWGGCQCCTYRCFCYEIVNSHFLLPVRRTQIQNVEGKSMCGGKMLGKIWIVRPFNVSLMARGQLKAHNNCVFRIIRHRSIVTFFGIEHENIVCKNKGKQVGKCWRTRKLRVFFNALLDHFIIIASINKSTYLLNILVTPPSPNTSFFFQYFVNSNALLLVTPWDLCFCILCVKCLLVID